MRVSCFMIFIILLSQYIRVQGQVVVNLNDFKTDDQLKRIEDFPSDRLSPGVKEAALYYNKNDDDYVVMLLFKRSDSQYTVISRLEVKDEEEWCISPRVLFDRDTIRMECSVMGALVAEQRFVFSERNELRFLGSFHRDLNEEVYLKAEQAWSQKDPLAYCEAYMGAQYYSMNYPYRVKESLMMADSIAASYYTKKEYTRAADLMYSMEQNCAGATTGFVAENFSEDFQRIWSDASLYYLKAGRDSACVNLCKWFTEMYPDFAPVYLQYGDALYAMKDRTYGSIYKTYHDLMNKQGKQDRVPPRVNARMDK